MRCESPMVANPEIKKPNPIQGTNGDLVRKDNPPWYALLALPAWGNTSSSIE